MGDDKSLPFGDRLKDEFNPGDLVEWGLPPDRPRGILVRVYIEEYDPLRKYWMAEIRENQTEQIHNVLLASISLIQSSVDRS